MADKYPSSLAKFVNKKVLLSLSDGSSREGWVYTVDPVTRSFVLLQTNAGVETASLTFVMGHTVKDVCVDIQSVGELCPDFDKVIRTRRVCSYSDEDLRRRKVELKTWLERNRLAVTEKESEILSVLGVLSIEPPYDMECCRCANEIILDRIQRLIKNMPCSSPTEPNAQNLEDRKTNL